MSDKVIVLWKVLCWSASDIKTGSSFFLMLLFVLLFLSLTIISKNLCFWTGFVQEICFVLWSPFTLQRHYEMRWKGIRLERFKKEWGGVLFECAVMTFRISHCPCSAYYSIMVTSCRNDIHFHFITNLNSTANIKWNKLCNLLCMW